MALTILFSSAGRRNQLMDCFRQDAAALGLELRVLAADLNPGLEPGLPAGGRRVCGPTLHRGGICAGDA